MSCAYWTSERVPACWRWPPPGWVPLMCGPSTSMRTRATSATQNIDRNQVGRDRRGQRDRIVGEFDVVVANITVPTLIELSADLRGARPAGRPPDSQWDLGSQETELVAAFAGIQWIERRSEDDWIALAGRPTG